MGKQNKTLKMTQTIEERVAEVLGSLDRFALQTSLPRPWHAEWQTVFGRVQSEIQALLTQKDLENG